MGAWVLKYLGEMKYTYFLRVVGGLLMLFGVASCVLAIIGVSDTDGGMAKSIVSLFAKGPTAPVPFACCILGGVYLLARK